MKLGLNDHTFLAAGRRLDALEIVKEAHALDLRGVHFSTLWSFKTLSDEYLSKIRRWSEDHDLYLEVGMGACNPYSDCRLERDRDRDPRETLKEIIPIAAKLGSHVVRTFFGFIKERFFMEPTLTLLNFLSFCLLLTFFRFWKNFLRRKRHSRQK